MIYEIVALSRFRKKTEKLCGMHIPAAEPKAYTRAALGRQADL